MTQEEEDAESDDDSNGSGEDDGEKPMSMDDNWWDSDKVSREEEAAVAGAAERDAPMDASAFSVSQPTKARKPTAHPHLSNGGQRDHRRVD